MNYTTVIQIGEGTYGKVYKVRCTETKSIYALKEIPLEKETGIPFTTYREIIALKTLKHKNIVGLHTITYEKEKINFFLEYMPFDLSALIRNNPISDELTKSLTYQILCGLKYIHSNNYIHRDIKSSNILIDKMGNAKITDFGLTRSYNPHMTNRVCTLWYRAPELLLGCTEYTNKIDTFSIGCIISEMKTGKILFKGNDEISQAKMVISIVGKPKTEYKWSHLIEYKYNKNRKDVISGLLGKYIKGPLLELVDQLLVAEPKQRISAANALSLKVFQNIKHIELDINKEEMHDFNLKEKQKAAPVVNF